jgi:hypothetical protein
MSSAFPCLRRVDRRHQQSLELILGSLARHPALGLLAMYA